MSILVSISSLLQQLCLIRSYFCRISIKLNKLRIQTSCWMNCRKELCIGSPGDRLSAKQMLSLTVQPKYRRIFTCKRLPTLIFISSLNQSPFLLKTFISLKHRANSSLISPKRRRIRLPTAITVSFC